MISVLKGKDLEDTAKRVMAVLSQNLDEYSPVSDIPKEEIYSACHGVIKALQTRNMQLKRANIQLHAKNHNRKEARDGMD